MTAGSVANGDAERLMGGGQQAGLAAQVVARFEQEDIAYCHWKSNEHLDAALSGETDFDVLIDAARMHDAYRVLSEFGCRRARVSAARNEPGLEDFLGHDLSTGRLVHFHVHWRLASGERHLKRFRLPWERAVLETRVRDLDAGCYVTAPAAEVVLVAVRAGLKLRWRDRARMRSGAESTSIAQELDWLMKSADEAEVGVVARAWLGERGGAAVERLVAEGPDRAHLLAVRRAALRVVGGSATHRGAAAPLVRWRREAVWFRRGVARHRRPSTVLHGRGGGAGGLLVAVVGADGSGKSTLTTDLRRWFAPKLDTFPVYFGSGDGPASALRAPLKVLRRMVLGTKQEVARKEAVGARHPQSVAAARAVWALALAAEKQRKLSRAEAARSHGLLVITDRYPQSQVHGSNDGPLLSGWRRSSRGVLRRLAAYEARPYDRADSRPPDVVLRLNVDLATALTRRPTHAEADLSSRIAIIGSLVFPTARYGVIELDASEPYELVLERAKSAIFERL